LTLKSDSSAELPVIRRILVAIDGSENAKVAVRVASQIARRSEAELTILHIMTIPFAAYSGDLYCQIDKIVETEGREGTKFVHDAILIAEQYGVMAKTALPERVNSPVKGITDYALKNRIDLIVVGTRKPSGFKRFSLASVASDITRHALCSVLVVR
jgi:nucleotide-binding universal stress UspA family protein